jgi:hypothetical protein
MNAAVITRKTRLGYELPDNLYHCSTSATTLHLQRTHTPQVTSPDLTSHRYKQGAIPYFETAPVGIALILFLFTERGETRIPSPLRGLTSKVSAEGLEPSTNGLKGHCSAIELRAQALSKLASGLHSITPQSNRQRNTTCPECVYYGARRLHG